MKKILKYLIILGILQANANASSEPPTEGLLAKYSFDNGKALDISGNNRHGKVIGATKTKDRFGEEDKALKFNGSSYVSVDGPWPSGTSSRSVVAWYNCPSHFGNLFTFGDGNKKKRNTRFSFLFNAKRGKYRHAVIGERNDHVLYNDSLFNNWRQIAITFDGLNGKAYVDGIGFGSFKTTFNTSGDLPLIIGSNSLNRNDEFYRGSIDELSIFDRYLNESEIQHSYKSSSTKEYKAAPDVTPPKTGPGDAPDLKCKETIAKLEAEIKDQKIEITDLNILIIELRKQVADLNSSNLALTTEVSGLKNQVNKLNGQVASLTNENGELKGQVTNLKEDNGNLQVTVTSLNEQLVEADRIAKTPFVHGWVYTPDHGWLHIDPQNFPIIYKNDTQSWHFYEQGSINPRYFYNFNEQKWESWDSIPSGSEN